jgi:putative membrane protein
MRTRWMTTALVAAAVALAPAWGFAQTATTDRAAADKSPKMASSDRKFVMEALKGGMAEVELGKLASERAANDGVKQFGKRMADDHGKAGSELMKLAQDKGLTAPSELDSKHARLRNKLAKLSGAEFDRAYVDEMVKDHRQDVKEFRREADKAKDPDVKAFAAKTLPTLEDHLKQVEGLQAQVKGTAKATERK